MSLYIDIQYTVTIIGKYVTYIAYVISFILKNIQRINNSNILYNEPMANWTNANQHSG